MTQEPRLGQHTLLVLNGILSRCASLAELERAIADYPEDRLREGTIIQGMQRFVSACGDFERVRQVVEQGLAEAGGLGYLESFRDQMDFNEFLYGWDESDRDED